MRLHELLSVNFLSFVHIVTSLVRQLSYQLSSTSLEGRDGVALLVFGIIQPSWVKFREKFGLVEIVKLLRSRTRVPIVRVLFGLHVDETYRSTFTFDQQFSESFYSSLILD